MVVLVKKDSCITYRGFRKEASDTSPSPWAAVSPISVLSLFLPSVVTTADILYIPVYSGLVQTDDDQ